MASITFPRAIGGDGSTVSDDASPATGLAAGGHRARFIPALAQVVAIAQYAVGLAQGLSNAMWAPVDGVILTNDTLSGLAARNGVTPNATQRWLVIGQTAGAQNGIYTPAAGAWTRTADADVAADFVAGKMVVVNNATIGNDQIYMFTTLGAITLGSTSLSFVPLPSLNNANTWTASQTFSAATTMAAALGMSGAAVNESMGADIASAATVNLDNATGNVVQITGTTAITAITLSEGRRRTVRFAGALTLTNGANLALPGGANIPTAAGDFADFVGYAGGVVRCVRYQEISGRPVLSNGDTMTGPLAMSGAAINETQGANIASAATINLDAATGNLVDVTGTTTITAVTLSQGRERTVQFTGALTLTKGANLVLPGGANITTAAGDYAIFRGYAGPLVKCINYTRANARPGNGPVVIAAGAINTAGDTTTITVPAGAFKKLSLNVSGLRAGSDFSVYVRFNSDAAANYDMAGYVADNTQSGTANWGYLAINNYRPHHPPNNFLGGATNVIALALSILDPASTTQFKSIMHGASSGLTAASNIHNTGHGGRWRNNDALVSIQIILRSSAASNLPAGSVSATAGDWFLTGELGVL